MGQRTRDRSFRRLESRSRTTAPIGLAWATGALLGALGGVGFLAWEALVLQAAGLSFAPGSTGLVFLGVYATMGAGIGWAAGATGLWGPRWSSAALILLVSWFLAVRLGQVASQSGAPGALGVGLAVLAGLVLGQLAGRVPGPGWVHLGVASFGLASLALAVPLQQHLLPGASVAGSVLIGVVLLLAVTLAGVVSAFTGDDRAPVVPLALWAALGGIGALVTRGGATPPAWEASTASGPPIVLVVISGLRADRTGVAGHERAKTPTLDALARRSLEFTGAHATSNWSVPSIASMLTGRLPYQHGAGLNDGAGPTGSALRADVVTLPMALRREGWATAGVVGDPSLRAYALDAGFQTWIDAPEHGLLPSLWAPVVASGLDPLRLPTRVPAEQVTDRALELVASQPGGGWMLLVQYADAGGPFLASPQDEQAVGYTTRPYPADRYDAAVHGIDRELGRLLAALPDAAWVVVVGDRGVQLGEQRSDASQSRVGMRFGHTMFEELLHVPLLVRAPGVGAARVEGAVSVADVAPTLARAAGQGPLPKAEGVPLERAFGEAQTDRVVVAQSSRFGPEQQAVLLGRHKLVHTAAGRTPLFDLAADPSESSPLPTGVELDNLERRMAALLPPPGAGANLQEPPSLVLRVGQLASRFLP